VLLFLGYGFTLIPLNVARQAFRSVTWRTRGVIWSWPRCWPSPT
jgi:hypothetical protein